MRSQVSLEYATTYGWGLLIIAVVVASLVYFGSFESDRHTESYCNLGPQMRCDDVAINLVGILAMGFQNNVFSNISIESVRLPKENIDCEIETGDPRFRMKQGGTALVMCDLGVGGYAGEDEEFNVEMKYKAGNSDRIFTILGKIRARTAEELNVENFCDTDRDGHYKANSNICVGGDDCFDNDQNSIDPLCEDNSDCSLGETCSIPANRCEAICVII